MKSPGKAFLVFSLIFYAEIGASDFKSQICNNDEFLTCLGATKALCVSSYTQSENDCTKQHPLSMDVENEERYKVARKFGECSMAGFISGLHIDRNKFEQCGNYLEPIFTEYSKGVEKAQKLNEERFRKLE